MIETKHDQNDSNSRGHASDDGKRKGWRFWLIFLSLCVAIIVCALDMVRIRRAAGYLADQTSQSSMATALPSITHDFGGTESFAWVSAVYALSTAAILPLCGRLAEIFGRRGVLLSSLVCFALGSLVCATARSMVTLIIGRGLSPLVTTYTYLSNCSDTRSWFWDDSNTHSNCLGRSSHPERERIFYFSYWSVCAHLWLYSASSLDHSAEHLQPLLEQALSLGVQLCRRQLGDGRSSGALLSAYH
jgi:hypothetical protein